MIWANVTRFGQNFIAPQIFWAGTSMSMIVGMYNAQKYISEFNKKVRSVIELAYWKAAEVS